MSRLKIEIDEEMLLEKRSQKKSIKEISSEMGISTATLSRRIAELENREGILTKYRELQNLQLTALQFRILQAITPDLIESASLTDLIRCYSILRKAESATLGIGRLRVSGLVQYLVELEKGDFTPA
jgi:DNA-binding Lrp family transcriptional regulator